MQRHRILIAARALTGVLFGLGIWWGLSGPYNDLVSAFAEPLVRALERSPATRLHVLDGNIVIEHRDFLPRAPRPALAAGNLTANIILLTALFATNSKALSKGNVSAFALACLAMFVVHVFAVVVNVHSIYALDFGAWSARNYGPMARTFWESATHFYTVAGSFGSAFLLWWLVSPGKR